MSDWRDSYDEWKTRSPDWDDDPCAEVRAECDAEMREMDEKIKELSYLLKQVLTETFPDPAVELIWRSEAYAALGIPDPNKPQEPEIAF